METKKCRACLEEKGLTDYHKDSSNKDGLCKKCKVCCKNKTPFKVIFSGKTQICSACKEDRPIEKYSSKNGKIVLKCNDCIKNKKSSRHIEKERYSQEKLCKCCNVLKTCADFSKHSCSKSGYKARCKECIKNKKEPVDKKILEGVKTCKTCKVEKDFSEFHNMSCKSDGKSPKCKRCITDRIFEEVTLVPEGFKNVLNVRSKRVIRSIIRLKEIPPVGVSNV